MALFRIIKPIVLEAYEKLKQNNQKGKLIIAGFAEGCSMSLYSFYSEKDKIDAVIGI
jgi:predicted esterase